MFLKFISFLQRIIYFRRYRSAENIRRAAALLGGDDAVGALFLLRDTKRGLHESLWPIYALTLGQVLVAMNRLPEAEKQFAVAVSLGDAEIAGRARNFLALLKPEPRS